MPILATYPKPTNGVLLHFHKAVSAAVNYRDGNAIVQVSSWPNAEAHDLGQPLDWQTPVLVPLTRLADVDAALIDITDSPFAGGTVVPDATDSLGAARLRKKAEIDVERDRRVLLPFEYAGVLFDGDAKSLRNIQGWQTQIANGVVLPADFTWRDVNNIDHPADAAYVNGLGAALTERGTVVYQQSWAMKAAVDAATTLEEVAAVGWPEIPPAERVAL